MDNQKDNCDNSFISCEELIVTINNILFSPTIKELPEQLRDNQEVVKLYDSIVLFRTVLASFSRGDFDVNIPLRGFLGGVTKSLQANLRHLSWQAQMVAQGDLTQRVEFMGEFSAAFNTMVTEFSRALKELNEQKELMDGITKDLHKEIESRIETEIALKKSEERYRKLARLDHLTGLYNRRHFFDLATTELERMIRNGDGVCTFAMLDIDHFKIFNDTYGHINGDSCLIEISNILKSQVRKFDIVARYGGEEFVIMLPLADISTGTIITERIRSAIENSPVKTDNGPVRVTASIGVAEMRVKGMKDSDIHDAIMESIAQADKALYEAKVDRNKVVAIKNS